mmetsp:Transcript_53187/g.142241  ORF Transcript_53187/g.142241 Transcript_53187/m.142241 type:complete len:229 (-) Transcript_53187:561-1247(-)
MCLTVSNPPVSLQCAPAAGGSATTRRGRTQHLEMWDCHLRDRHDLRAPQQDPSAAEEQRVACKQSVAPPRISLSTHFALAPQGTAPAAEASRGETITPLAACECELWRTVLARTRQLDRTSCPAKLLCPGMSQRGLPKKCEVLGQPSTANGAESLTPPLGKQDFHLPSSELQRSGTVGWISTLWRLTPSPLSSTPPPSLHSGLPSELCRWDSAQHAPGRSDPSGYVAP